MYWLSQAANGKEKNYDFVNVNCKPKQLTLTAAWVAVLVVVAVQVTQLAAKSSLCVFQTSSVSVQLATEET